MIAAITVPYSGRAVRQTSDLPIIMITSSPFSSTFTEAEKAGANTVVMKPINHAVLFAHIRRLLCEHTAT